MPTVSSTVFLAFQCRFFDGHADEGSRSYLMADLSVECNDGEKYNAIVRDSIVFMVIWPISGTALFAWLLYASQRPIIERKPNAMSRATSMLHKEFEAPYFYWCFALPRGSTLHFHWGLAGGHPR